MVSFRDSLNKIVWVNLNLSFAAGLILTSVVLMIGIFQDTTPPGNIRVGLWILFYLPILFGLAVISQILSKLENRIWNRIIFKPLASFFWGCCVGLLVGVYTQRWSGSYNIP